MLHIKARDLVGLSFREVWAKLPDTADNLPQRIALAVDDGEVVTNNRMALYSWFCWEFHRRYPETPLLVAHVHPLEKRISSSSHLDLLSPIYFDCADTYMLNQDQLEELDRLAYEVTNALYNFAVSEIEEYVETLSFDDYIEVAHSPNIKQSLATVKPNRISLKECHTVVKTELMDAPDLAKNPLAEFCRSGFISMGQVLQCVAPRGFVTDIDSTFFRKPILKGYVQGIYELGDSGEESRGASKALFYSKDHVEKGEYFNRKMQLGCSVIQHLFAGDCGTNRFLQMTVDSEDIFSLDGKYMKMPGTDKLHRIDAKADREWLLKEVKTIEIRSAIHCRALGRGGICQTCFGELGRSIVAKSNLGHVCSSVVCHDASQSVLSVKHDDTTAEFDKVNLGEVEQEWLEVSSEDVNQLHLIKPGWGSNYRLVVEAKYLKNLGNVNVAPDIEKLSIPAITSIHDLELWYIDEDGFDQVVQLTVANGARYASLTLDALIFAREHPWGVTDDGRYVFDLSKWTYELPMFVLPVKHANMIEFINDIETFVRSSGAKEITENRQKLINHADLETGLLQFHKLVATKLKVNLGHLEVIVASTTARSDDDYRLPECASDGVVVSYEELIRGRSLAGALAYEHLERIYGVHDTYMERPRMWHPMDDIMANMTAEQLAEMKAQEEVAHYAMA